MDRIKRADSYDIKWLETERPQPLVDLFIEQLIQDVLTGKIDKDISNQVYTHFKQEMTAWIFGSKLNALSGFDSFSRVDVINGCTQFIDNIYMQEHPQVLVGDYRYHNRLGNQGTQHGLLKEKVPLVIAMPFPNIGAIHENMTEILDECLEKEIPVHIDGAWYTCCRDIVFDVGHSAIHSIGISLSKGLGLGWNRVGLRWTKNSDPDAVTIMNDFNMNLRAPVMIGLHFLRNLQPDYLWNNYGDTYYKICKDFNLTPTKSIYLALQNNQPVGLSPLIRYAANQ
jgi:hypothetical protein